MDDILNSNKKTITELDDNSIDLLEKELELILSNKPIIDIQLSQEQQNIINSLENIIIDAVAGSGKTTTILHMGLKYPDKNIFQITYNNMLKKEVRKKVNRLCLSNMTIHTYHSLAVKYYNHIAYTDEEIKKILLTNIPINNLDNNIRSVDILFIDEVQDMNIDYYNLVKKFIKDTVSKPQIIILGDKYQGIYDFKGADIKFLTLADKIWDLPFIKLDLSLSYRLTNQIGWFVNNIMLKHDRIKTDKNGPIVDYYIGNSYEIYKKIGKQIRLLIKDENILASDIFILTPSVKSIESPYKKLENYLVKHGIKCTTPSSDDSKLDERVISNKVVFTTYHQSKGRERKVVILYNFDDSYTQYFNKDKNNVENCPNILYVGATRASWKLILIQDSRHKPLEFLNISKLKNNSHIQIQIINKQNLINTKLSKNIDIKKISITDLIKFITPATIDLLIKLIDNDLFTEIKKSSDNIDIPNKIKINSKINNILDNNLIMWEDVSDLNGLVIPAIYEKILTGNNSTIENYVFEQIKDKNIWNEIKKYVGKINIPAKNYSDYLKIGNIYLSIQNKLHAKLAQIQKYDWLNIDMITSCHSKMDIIKSDTLFEIVISSNSIDDYFEYIHPIFGIIHLRGRIDAIDKNNVWEFKCVDYITIEHKLQIILYSWAWKKTNMKLIYGNKDFFLLNIKSGQTLKLNYNDYIIEEIIELIFQDKYLEKKNINDNDFILMCNK